MAAVADYGVTDVELGRYGIYNPFAVRITRTGGTVYKLKYRIALQVNGVDIGEPKHVDPISEVAIINPVDPLKGQFFETQLIGNNGVGNAPLDSSGANADKSYALVRIRIGEVSATAADEPATFGGYDSDKSIYFYNGYNSNVFELNYRPDNLYQTTPFKLPMVNKAIKMGDNDIHFISAPSVISTAVSEETPGDGGLLDLAFLHYIYYDAAGDEISTSNLGLGSRYGSLLGYWTIQIGTAQLTYPSNWASAKYWVEWRDSNSNAYLSEEFFVYRQQCDPKFKRYRLRWFNRYSGFEYFNFTKKSSIQIDVQKGKEVRTSGINYDAVSFSEIKYPAIPERREVGKSATTTYSIATDFITNEEQESLRDLYTSPNVIMFDEDNNIFPVIMQDRSMTITDIKDGLVKASVKVELANDNKVIMQ